ncbi:MAG: FAA hydrolase family protein [Bacteroidetes bacterium]|nr:MAG: FAA hydrolase family protein [Bacteroidota bacterium]MBL1145850.1 FAA hydrolase family protein [Bacteroidota bacterium]MCB0803841.1 fumarylacetoacetate hydrolase family protein [Flavobacteriales bacterium]NOG58644.1 fumarylacetoacetate hydrolase family protein [Bacteroidota bacterium]
MKIICIGRNYADHAAELNNPVPKEPVVFLKPETALIPKNQPFFYPDFSNDIHFEAEIVVKINRLGKNIATQFAHKYYEEISLGIDFTARDIQQRLKEKGLPWEKAKAFDHSAPTGKFIPKSKLKNLNDFNFSLLIDGETKQKGNTKNMLFSIDAIIAEVSKYFTLKIGDLIFTGTPAGVGPIAIGNHLEGFIEEEKVFNLKIR